MNKDVQICGRDGSDSPQHQKLLKQGDASDHRKLCRRV